MDGRMYRSGQGHLKWRPGDTPRYPSPVEIVGVVEAVVFGLMVIVVEEESPVSAVEHSGTGPAVHPRLIIPASTTVHNVT